MKWREFRRTGQEHPFIASGIAYGIVFGVTGVIAGQTLLHFMFVWLSTTLAMGLFMKWMQVNQRRREEWKRIEEAKPPG